MTDVTGAVAGSGSEPFGFKYSARWHRDRFDQEHACTFVSEPSVMKDRICVKGRCWLVPAGPHACDVVYHEEISVRVFGVGSVVEQVRPERAALEPEHPHGCAPQRIPA